MDQNNRIPLDQTINGTTVHIKFSDKPPRTGMEQIRSILLSSWKPLLPDTGKGMSEVCRRKGLDNRHGRTGGRRLRTQSTSRK